MSGQPVVFFRNQLLDKLNDFALRYAVKARLHIHFDEVQLLVHLA